MIGINLYHHIIIAVCEVYLDEFAIYFDSNDVLFEKQDVAFVAQTGHGLKTRLRNYGLQNGYPTRLQPLLMQRYREISQALQRFFYFVAMNAGF